MGAGVTVGLAVSVAETVGVERRGKFYEQTGAMRDMVPNHMFQLLSLIAMEPPISFDAEAVRDKKAEVIQAIRPVPDIIAAFTKRLAALGTPPAPPRAQAVDYVALISHALPRTHKDRKK